jgi:hypothetical protein
MASGALVLSILGYISGWTEARSYFETLGALWAASMLSPLRLLQLSTDLISATAFTAIVSIRWAASALITTGFWPDLFTSVNVALNVKPVALREHLPGSCNERRFRGSRSS